MSGYVEFLQQVSNAKADAEEAVVEALFNEFPELRSAANAQIILGYYREGNIPVPATVDELKASLAELEKSGLRLNLSVKSAQDLENEKAQAAQQAEDERQALIAEMSQRLQRAGNPAHVVQGEIRSRYTFMNVQELRGKVSAMDEEKRLRSMSPKALLQEIKANARLSSREPLPARYTAEVLRQLTSGLNRDIEKLNQARVFDTDLNLETAPKKYRELAERYGVDSLNARLGYVAPAQPGTTWSR